MKTVQDVKNFMLKFANEEYLRELPQLENEVRFALKCNPHNTFKGTAQEYIKKYNLDVELKEKIFKHYTV